MIIQICVGSSCHLKGSEEVVRLFQEAIKTHKLEREITLTGSFCMGACNGDGVSVAVDDIVYPGISKENFKEFFDEKVLGAINNKGA